MFLPFSILLDDRTVRFLCQVNGDGTLRDNQIGGLLSATLLLIFICRQLLLDHNRNQNAATLEIGGYCCNSKCFDRRSQNEVHLNVSKNGVKTLME